MEDTAPASYSVPAAAGTDNVLLIADSYKVKFVYVRCIAFIFIDFISEHSIAQPRGQGWVGGGGRKGREE